MIIFSLVIAFRCVATPISLGDSSGYTAIGSVPDFGKSYQEIDTCLQKAGIECGAVTRGAIVGLVVPLNEGPKARKLATAITQRDYLEFAELPRKPHYIIEHELSEKDLVRLLGAWQPQSLWLNGELTRYGVARGYADLMSISLSADRTCILGTNNKVQGHWDFDGEEVVLDFTESPNAGFPLWNLQIHTDSMGMYLTCDHQIVAWRRKDDTSPPSR